jgi:hypothetical protein
VTASDNRTGPTGCMTIAAIRPRGWDGPAKRQGYVRAYPCCAAMPEPAGEPPTRGRRTVVAPRGGRPFVRATPRKRGRPFGPAALVALGLILATAAAAEEPGAASPDRPSRPPTPALAEGQGPPRSASTQLSTPAFLDATLAADRRRLVTVFDFNERPLGNYEALPMRWTRHQGWGFPHYLEAGFDEAVGHDASPSFRLSLNGGSVAFHYRNRGIEVVPNSEYVVFAWVRTRDLKRARAFISAGLMDRSGDDIAGTETFSRSVGGPQQNDQWHRLEVHLPGGVRNARFINLSVWLTQPGALEGNRRGTPASADDVEDTHGNAWFDDLQVYRLPRVLMETGVAGNVFEPGRTPSLLVLVSDPDGAGLKARLVVRDADETPRMERAVAIKRIDQIEPDRIELPDLEAGLYRAELLVTTSSSVLASRTVRLARLGPRFMSDESAKLPGRGFGVAVTQLPEKQLADQLALIEQLAPEWVKVPVWLLASASSPDIPASSPAIEAHLTRLSGGGHEVVGWIGPDRQTPEQRREIGSLLDVLSAPPAKWRPRLAYVWSVYAGLIRWWQVGDEQDAELVWDPRLPAAAGALRKELSDVVNNPLVVVPGNVLKAPGNGQAATSASENAVIAAFVSSEIPPGQIAGYWRATRDSTSPNLWVTIEPLPAHRYPRRVRAADLTKRLVLAKANNAAAVFIPEPWITSQTGKLWPTEDYLVFRTVADLLGGSSSAGTLTIDGRVECHVFDRGGQAVMAVWDDYAASAGRDHWMLLGPGAKQIDPWGHSVDLPATGPEYRVRIGQTPTFVGPLPTWLVKLRQSFAIVPPHVEASLMQHEATIRFANPFAEPISGEVRLVTPPGWEVRPSYFPFALSPKQVHEERVSLTFPLNESSGTKVILSNCRIEAERNYRLAIPVWFELGLEGIEVETFTQRTGDQVVIRQSVTNRTGDVVSFYGYLTAANRERLNRLIANLQPGQTATKEYVLDNALQLAGHRLRLGLQEVGGSRVWNCLVDAP